MALRIYPFIHSSPCPFRIAGNFRGNVVLVYCWRTSSITPPSLVRTSLLQHMTQYLLPNDLILQRTKYITAVQDIDPYDSLEASDIQETLERLRTAPAIHKPL